MFILESIDIADPRHGRLLAHDKTITKAALRKEVYRCVDMALRTWKRGDEFVFRYEPPGSISGEPVMARLQFQTGLIQGGDDE
jgi:hypothetical protein